MESLESIVKKFRIYGEITVSGAHGNGHINCTNLVLARDSYGFTRRYILQVINKTVFKNPRYVMENICSVTEFLNDKDIDPRSIMRLVPTIGNKFYYVDKSGNYWRVYDYVEDSLCLDRPETAEDFYESALGFGRFQYNLNDFPAEQLHEIIPDFHNTPKRYKDFLEAVKSDACGRAKNVLPEIEFVKARESFYSVLNESHEKGELPLRVTHNDTKMNNVLLDKNTRKALCVIDLDTIMPGYSVTDFGDAIRFGASTAAEDEKDLTKVKLDIELFKIYTKGFLGGCGGLLKESEIMLLPEGAKMMTVECGMRFLTDYLNGDTYFRTDYPEHNLIRCRTQFKLVREMEDKWDELKSIVKEYV